MEIELLYFDGCPSWQLAAARLEALAADGVDVTVQRTRVASETEAVRLGFVGSPSLHLDGRELFPDPSAQVGFACRRYLTPAGFQGAPTTDQIRVALASPPESEPSAA